MLMVRGKVLLCIGLSICRGRPGHVAWDHQCKTPPWLLVNKGRKLETHWPRISVALNDRRSKREIC
mgnify:CR=1 FL=1